MTNSNSFQAEKINQHIVQWLHDYAINAKVKGFVVVGFVHFKRGVCTL